MDAATTIRRSPAVVVEYDLEWQLAAKQLLRTEMHRQASGLTLHLGGAGIALSAETPGQVKP